MGLLLSEPRLLLCGFGANGLAQKRLTEFKNKGDDITHMMFTGIMGRSFSPRDALQHLKDAYGIDLYESQYREEYEEDAKRNAEK